jgi:hypothetical protein
MKKIRLLLLIVAMAGISETTKSQVFDLTTGTSAVGTKDPIWDIDLPGGGTNFVDVKTSTNFVQSYTGALWNTGYAQNTCGNWISPYLNGNNHISNSNIATGNFTYQRSFLATCVNNTAVINFGFVAADNNVTAIMVNGFNLTIPVITHLPSVSIPATSVPINPGVWNTVTVVVNNSGSFTGLQLCGEITLTPAPCPTADGHFSSPHTIVQDNSKFGLVDVAEFCFGDPVIIDGSASSNENSWAVEVSTFDFVGWGSTPFYNLTWQVPASQVPNSINVMSFFGATTPVIGQVYRFNLGVGQPWHSKEFFFRFTGATARGHFSSPHTIVQDNSLYGPQNVAEFCMGDPVIIDGSASTCEDSWAVEISTFDLMNWQSVPFYNLTWQVPTSQVPNSIDVMSFFTLSSATPIIGQVYRFNLGVGQPWHSKEFFFKFKCCNTSLDLGPDITICEGSSAPYIYVPAGAGTPGNIPTIQWKYNGVNTNTSSPNQPLSGLFGSSTPMAGMYTVEIMYPGCDTLRDTIYLNLVDPFCDIDANFNLDIKDCRVFFWNNSVINPPTTFVSYFWDFGDGNTSTAMNPAHYYTSSGTFVVTLTVNGLDNCGNPCSATYSETIDMDCEGYEPKPESESNESSSKPETLKVSSLNIYPNPNSGNFRVKHYIPINSQDSYLAIRSIEGKEIMKQNVNCVGQCTSTIKLNSNNEIGTYFCSLYVDGKLVKSVRLVISK